MDIRNLGNFPNLAAVWQAYPSGGLEGDYLYIPNTSGVKYSWNKYARTWGIEDDSHTPSRQGKSVSDLYVQNELNVGSIADFHGDVQIRGKLYAKHVKQPNVGMFATLAALQAAYPHPEVGMWATVGDSMPGAVFRCNTTGTWTATGGTGGVDEIYNVLLYSQQSLTDAQKKQARQNLGFGNGDFATGSDFDDPDSTKRAKVVTVGAVLDGADAVPTAGSDKLLKSGGVYLKINQEKQRAETSEQHLQEHVDSVKNAVAGIGRFAVVNHWIYAITDATGKVVLGIKENGSVFANGFVNNIVVAKDGSGDYDNLSQAIIDTYGKKNVVLNILPGVYNIIEEMKELYGDDYWDNYDRDQKIIYPDMYYDYGLRLGNGIILKGSSGTHIICKYTGNNDNVKVYFSPFNNDTGGFKMINLSIECSNVRYCVHDERGIDNVPYEVLYDSCYMESSNSTEASSPWKSNACIGGGLGINGHVKVINSVFNSTANNSILVSYHDSSGDFTVYTDDIGYVSPQNYVICSGNYIKGQNGFGFTWNSKNGESETKILCYGNSVGRQTHIGRESSAVSHDCDIEVLEWNNVIRNV